MDLATPVIPAAELHGWLAGRPLLGPGAAIQNPLVFVDLDQVPRGQRDCAALRRTLQWPSLPLLVGFSNGAPSACPAWLADALDFTLAAHDLGAGRSVVAVDGVGRALQEIERAVLATPVAALLLRNQLRAAERLSLKDALERESLAYSILLGGGEFSRWRASRAYRSARAPPSDPVRVDRNGDQLWIVLDDPARHNAFSRNMRDALLQALDLALADERLQILIEGAGPSFCSGGDLDEFGTACEFTMAHLIRLEASAALRLLRCARRTEVRLHGACIGAGIELASFAARIHATPGAWFQLPEVGMGLIPGAGGTVGLTARVGRWRCAYMALTGRRIDASTALSWGLVDTVDQRPAATGVNL